MVWSHPCIEEYQWKASTPPAATLDLQRTTLNGVRESKTEQPNAQDRWFMGRWSEAGADLQARRRVQQ